VVTSRSITGGPPWAGEDAFEQIWGDGPQPRQAAVVDRSNGPDGDTKESGGGGFVEVVDVPTDKDGALPGGQLT
jgi:hypothetical protein